ncbi:YfhO family protein [Clostridium beijerinckii]|uniref:YfhO family protein n=1 Tax=Clostridium beijerinckii TaxID=1520 RepID=UPI00232C3826|nr:YfhO family protein [Clostridium beijerinckii]
MYKRYKRLKIENGLISTIIILFIMSIFLFRKFLIFGKLYLFDDAGGDTLISYWPHYNNIFSKIHDGTFTWWNFNNGLGNSVITRIQDLVDPFNILFYFIDPSKIPYALGYIAALKIVLAGVFFYLFLGLFKCKNTTKIIVAILYAFNGYIILWGQHYAFATIMVYVPLLLYFYEMWFQKGKFVGFVIISFCISIFSFYFTYITSIFLFIYALMRYLEEKEFYIKDFFIYFIKTLGLYVLGILMSSVILFPYLSITISSPRIGNGTGLKSIFSLDSLRNYIIMIERMFNNDVVIKGNLSLDGWWNYYESPILYCGVITLLLLPQILILKDKKKKNIYLAFLALMVLFLIFPVFSLMMTGFSAVYYRWTYVIIIFELYFVAKVIDEVILEGNINIKLLIGTFIFEVFISTFVLLYSGFYQKIGWSTENTHSALKALLISVIFMTIYSIMLIISKIKKYRQHIMSALCILICIEVVTFANSDISNRATLDSSYIGTQGYYDDSMKLIEYIKSTDNDFYRIDKSFLSQSYSDSYMQNFYGLKAYDSLNKYEYIDFIKTLNVTENFSSLPNFIPGFYSRPKLQILLGVKYIINRDGEAIPFGYKFIKKFGELNLYENENTVPLGFTYDKVINIDELKKYNSNVMDDILLNSAVIDKADDYEGNYDKIDVSELSTCKNIDDIQIKRISGNNIKILNSANKNEITYKAVNDDPNVLINLSEVHDTDNLEISFGVDIKKDEELQIFWKNKDNGFSEDKSIKQVLKKGYNNVRIPIKADKMDTLRIDLGMKNETLTLENINTALMGKVEFDNVPSSVERLRQDNFQITSFQQDHINSKVNVNKDKILCFSIPYDKGWTVKVDGIEVNTHKVNVGLLGVEMKQGGHNVELIYQPPLLKMGMILSIFTAVILVLLKVCNRKFRRIK